MLFLSLLFALFSLSRKIAKVNAFEKKKSSIQKIRRERNDVHKKNITLLQECQHLEKERDRAVARYFCCILCSRARLLCVKNDKYFCMIRLNDKVQSYLEVASAKVMIEVEHKRTKKQLGCATKSLKAFKARDESLQKLRRERNEMKIQNKQLEEERDRAVTRCFV